MSNFLLHIVTPILTAEKYAELIGVSVGVIESQMTRGQLPVVKQGKRRYINLALITKQALEAEY